MKEREKERKKETLGTNVFVVSHYQRNCVTVYVGDQGHISMMITFLCADARCALMRLLLIAILLLCHADIFLINPAAAMNNFTLRGIQDYTPYGPTFEVGGSMLGCDLQLAAPIADVWFKSLSVDADSKLDATAGKSKKLYNSTV